MSISRRGNSWRARYYGPDGRQRNKSFKHKRDAERWLTQQQNGIVKGDWIDPARGRVTFTEFVPMWRETRTNAKPKTRHQQESVLKVHILPTWQAMQLDRITFEGLSRWVSTMTDGGVGWSSIRQSVSCPLSLSMPYAPAASGLILPLAWRFPDRAAAITCS